MPRQFCADGRRRSAFGVLGFKAAACGLAGLISSALAVQPDFVVSQIPTVQRWGAVGGVVGFTAAIGTCNLGDADGSWTSAPGQYPLFVQNLYRMENGRFEQIAMSWANHNVICALQTQTPVCGTCTGSGGCQPFLAPGCLNSNTAVSIGQQPNLGPRTEINPWLGSAPFPFTTQGQTGDAIFKRMQVAGTDIDPALHASARYFLEVQVVAPSEPNDAKVNNATFREVTVIGTDASNFNLAPTGAAILGHEAILAWSTFDPMVRIDPVPVSNDGHFTLGARVTQLGPGQFRYDYSLHNLNVERAARAFHVITGNAGISQPYFHDVYYHSGDTPDGTDWMFVPGAVIVRWETQTFAQNPNANALRWGTQYNFSFVSNLPPIEGFAIVELFKPGSPSIVNANTLVPHAEGVVIGDMNCDGVVSVADIGPFVMGLTDPAGYAAAFPGCSLLRGDCTNDGQLTVSDIGCFVMLVTGG